MPVNGTLTLELYVHSAKDGSRVNESHYVMETFDRFSYDWSYENEAFREISWTGENGEYTITGQASVYEATFHYAVSDGHYYLDEGFVTTTAGGPAWGDFSFDILIAEKDLPFQGTIMLELFAESAEDQSRMHELNIPLEKFPK